MGFTASSYQQAIFDFIQQGRGNGIVNAVAGAGKTTTLVDGAKRLASNRAVFLAFNKHNAEALVPKLEGTGMQAKTVHGLAYGCLAKTLGGSLQVDNQKYRTAARRLIEEATRRRATRALKRTREGKPPPLPFAAVELPNGLHRQPSARDMVRDLVAAAHFLRVTLTDPKSRNASGVLARYGLWLHPDLQKLLPTLLRDGERLAEAARIVDFDDMLWLTAKWALRPYPQDWVFVDECQDLSPAQLCVAQAACGPGGRMLFVGDPRQSIFGFAGADPESFDRIREATDARELPLSICYRCPRAVVREARSLVPHLEWAPDAAEGRLTLEDEESLLGIAREGDMILCRFTAPLIAWCIRLIEQGIPARVKGRDIGEDLCSILDTLAEADGFHHSETLLFLREWEAQQVQYLAGEDADEAAVEAIRDRCAAVRACHKACRPSSLDALKGYIKGLFTDDRPSVLLSTVHRAKGLENRRVLILRPDKLPFVWSGQQEWQYQQELNLKYVAITRAQEELVWLRSKEERTRETQPAQDLLLVDK